jgi:hypothetical protein
MSCVNTKLQEFRDTVTRLDVHPDSLEVVLHKFLGAEPPTDGEIRKELRAKPFTGGTLGDFKLWLTKGYDKARTFGNITQATECSAEVESLLGKGKTSTYRDSKGNYVVSVGTPIMSKIGIPIDNTLIDSIESRIDTSSPHYNIFKPLVSLIGKDNIQIRQSLVRGDELGENGHPAMYKPIAKEIVFFPENMLGDPRYSSEDKSRNLGELFTTLTHELAHQLGFDALDRDPSSLTSAEKKFRSEIESIYQEAKEALGDGALVLYGMKNTQEFFAEALSNIDFQRELAKIKSSKTRESLWKKLVNAFKEFLGKDISGTLLADVLSASEEFMEKVPEIEAERTKEAEIKRAESELLDEIFREEMEGLGAKQRTQRISQEQVLQWEAEVKKRIEEFNRTRANSDASVARDFIDELKKEFPWYITDSNPYHLIVEEKRGSYDSTRGYTRKRLVSFQVGNKRLGNNTSTANAKLEAAIKARELQEQRAKNLEELKLTEEQNQWLSRLEEIGRADLADKVRDGLLDIDELMLYEDELSMFAEATKEGLTPETDARVQMFSGEFEGGYNSLVGLVPEPLLSRVENYIMSAGQFGLSEADAQQFLNYAEQFYATQESINQEEQPIKKDNQSYMEKAVAITQQIDNLNNSTALSATEVRHVAEQAVYWISDHITELQETPGLAERIYGEQFKDKDFASMSRADVVRTIGADSMIAMCREKFSPENTDYEDFDTIEKAEVITDNWGAIMMLASDVFLSVEDFSITSSNDGRTSEVNTDLVADADNFSTTSNMEADVLENEGDLQEHWQVETKTLDVLATMSQMVRQALTKCYLLDENGNKITSEFGINERVNAREATNSILRWTQGALNLEQMIAKLQEKSESNPWVKQIIDRLSDTSGKETDFQGQFFGTFLQALPTLLSGY